MVAAAAAAHAARKRAKVGDVDNDSDDDTPRTGSARTSKAPEGPKVRTRFQWVADIMRQEQVRALYLNPMIQWFIAALIIGNFLTNIVEKQIDPWGTIYPAEWDIIEKIWNSIFIVELLWNLYGCWYISTCKGHFLCSGWNWFDTLVVVVSIPSLMGIKLPPPSDKLRLLRAFRVFRLFKRIKSLNKILNSLGRAVPGIINAAVVQLIVMCIYAILAVDLFGDFGAQGNYTNINGDEVEMITTRNMNYGDEYYGNFFRSLYTLFQVLTGESWSEAVARPVIFQQGDTPYVGGIFYITYVIICGIVLVNVAVAVLLEKMVEPPEEIELPDGIALQALPEPIRIMLEPLDASGDGIISSEELTRAANLLKKDMAARACDGDPPEDGEGGDAGSQVIGALIKATQAEVRTAKESQNADITQLREEIGKREREMLDALHAAAEREELLQSSLQALSATMETMSHAAVRKRKPANRARTGLDANNEDKAQDGEREPTKGRAERQRL